MTSATGARHPIRVLFVCSGNSARSLMAEATLRHHGGAAFEVFSAGTEPKGVNPLTLRVLAETGIDASAAEGSEEERLAVFRRTLIQISERTAQFAAVATRRAS